MIYAVFQYDALTELMLYSIRLIKYVSTGTDQTAVDVFAVVLTVWVASVNILTYF